MWRLRLILAIGVLFALAPSIASAQPGCMPEAIRLDDMAGVYVSPELAARIEVYPCGGVYLQWDNETGRHVYRLEKIG
jgi:hypothetical protein